MQEKLNLFKKGMKGQDGSKWDNYFAMNADNISIKVNLTDDAKKAIMMSGIDFPLAITLDDKDYFITNDSYTNNDGVKVKVAVCVIMSFTKIEKADLEKKSLADYFKDKQLEDNGIQA